MTNYTKMMTDPHMMKTANPRIIKPLAHIVTNPNFIKAGMTMLDPLLMKIGYAS